MHHVLQPEKGIKLPVDPRMVEFDITNQHTKQISYLKLNDSFVKTWTFYQNRKSSYKDTKIKKCDAKS